MDPLAATEERHPQDPRQARELPGVARESPWAVGERREVLSLVAKAQLRGRRAIAQLANASWPRSATAQGRAPPGAPLWRSACGAPLRRAREGQALQRACGLGWGKSKGKGKRQSGHVY